jgi:hypothetical protein
LLPVITIVDVNTPNCGGQDANNVTVPEETRTITPIIDAATNLSATVDGKKVTPVGIVRVTSKGFAVVLPQDNLFGCPPGVYSPAVADGYYALSSPLSPGSHTLHLQADDPAGTVAQDVTYNLTVFPVTLQ